MMIDTHTDSVEAAAASTDEAVSESREDPEVEVDPQTAETEGSESPAPTSSSSSEDGAPAPGDDEEAPTPGDEEPRRPRAPRSPMRSGGQYAKVAEARAWHRFNSDGSLNIGSYEMHAAMWATSTAYEHLSRHLRELAADQGDVQPVNFAQVTSLARYLLGAADRAQAAVRRDGHFDRMDNSHARARGAVRQALAAHPIPWGASADDRDEWLEDLAGDAAELLRIAAAIVTG